MKASKFPKEAERALRPLEIVHSDVVGPITPISKGGSKYLVTFVDDFSRYTVVKPIKSKSNVLEKFEEYKNKVENFHDTKIKLLRSDNGGEYLSKLFDEHLKQHGIARQLTVPGTPQQNGVAERANQTLFDMTRCLLIQSGVPNYLWADAVNTACYIKNKCPTTALNGKIPEDVWTNKKCDIDHLRVFGCRAFSKLDPKNIKGKLSPRAEECIMIGYVEGVKGYKLWNVEKDRFFVSRNVRFEEAVFPFKKQVCVPNIKSEEFNVCIYNENPTNPEDDGRKFIETPRELSQELNLDGAIQINDMTENMTCEAEEEMDEGAQIDPDMKSNDSPTEIRRSRRDQRLPRHLNDYVVYNTVEGTQKYSTLMPDKNDPTTVKEAMESPEAESWKRAINEERKNLEENQTWELVHKPPNVKIIGTRWLFRKKYDEKGNVKYKARLVAKGYLQIPGTDFTETFSPVIKIKSIRILLALAVEMNYDIHQMDIIAAYLNGTLNEDIYIAQPEGCEKEGKEHLVCHLKRSLYGLKQSGRVWNTCLDSFLAQYNLRRSIADPCIYHNLERGIIIGVYVDDLLIIGKIEEINIFKREIKKQFTAKDLGQASHILSMKISRDKGGSVVTLDQTMYITEILDTFGMNNAKPAATPLDQNMTYLKVDDQQWKNIKEESSKIPFRQAIGSLLYLACGTRPDLSYPTTFLSQFNERPSEEHWRGVKHILRYLKGTKDRKLRFQKNGKKLEVFSDADWGADRTDRKSYSGYVLLLSNAPVSWSSKKQTTTALSSTEAEYISMCHVAKEVLWINNLFKEVCCDFVCKPQKIFVDSQSAIFMAENSYYIRKKQTYKVLLPS